MNNHSTLVFQTAPDEHCYLVTGVMPKGQDGQPQLGLGYVVASSAEEALKAQKQQEPDLQVTGVVSLAELKQQIEMFNDMREGRLPCLVAGSYATDLMTQIENQKQ